MNPAEQGRPRRPPEAVVLGAGVSGLTTGVVLAEAGWRVSLLASRLPPETTSDRAAAIWFPYRADPRDRVLAWSRRTLEVLSGLAAAPEAAVSRIELLQVFTAPQPDPWWLPAVGELRRAAREELPAGYADGWVVRVPLVETPRYLPYLMRRLVAAGGRISRLASPVSRLREIAGGGRLIVNCSGLGAGELCDDPLVFPIRGQVARFANPGLGRALLDAAPGGELTHVFPRPLSGDCIVGGTEEEGEWREQAEPEAVRAIVERARRLVPGLAGQSPLESWAGLRPGRDAVRLELERLAGGSPVIHNYGHGGAGFTLSWGCAEEVLALAQGVRDSRRRPAAPRRMGVMRRVDPKDSPEARASGVKIRYRGHLYQIRNGHWRGRDGHMVHFLTWVTDDLRRRAEEPLAGDLDLARGVTERLGSDAVLLPEREEGP